MPDPGFLGPRYQYSRDARARVLSGLVGTEGEHGGFDLDRQIQGIIDGLHWLAPLEPDGVIVWTGAQGDRSAAEAWDMSVEGLGRVDDEARKLGLPLALETCNPRYAADYSILDTIDTALALIDDVGTENVGVLIDVFHVWETDDLFGQIERAAGRINGVHVVDIAETPRSCQDRLIPGDGVADLPGLIRAVEETGFRGWYDCEVVIDANFPDSVALARLSADEIAIRCVTGFLEASKRAYANA
jgi:sugar phosphate isomerase/epimerase